MYGYEWSFGWNDFDPPETGVFACLPKQCEMHTYREPISLGVTTLSRAQVNDILVRMNADRSDTYVVYSSPHTAEYQCQTASDAESKYSQ